MMEKIVLQNSKNERKKGLSGAFHVPLASLALFALKISFVEENQVDRHSLAINERSIS